MFYFEGSKCSRCSAEFTENDDIVACPVCGSPHHRTCYTEHGGCANEALHEEGYSWKRDSSSAGEEDEAASSKTFCGVCGAENTAGRLYCFNCGKPLFDDEAGAETVDSNGYDIYDRECIQDVPIGDLKRFMGNSGALYVPLFYQMDRMKKKVSFNFLGLFAPTFWYFSRKMYLHGIGIVLFNLVSYAFSLLNYDAYMKIYNASFNLDAAALEAAMEQNPYVAAGFIVFGLMSYAIAILSALFCNKIYMNWSLRKIKRIRKAKKDNEQYHKALEACGRSNIAIVIVLMLVYLVAYLGVEKLFI